MKLEINTSKASITNQLETGNEHYNKGLQGMKMENEPPTGYYSTIEHGECREELASRKNHRSCDVTKVTRFPYVLHFAPRQYFDISVPFNGHENHLALPARCKKKPILTHFQCDVGMYPIVK
jgi:hypothetical protein